MKLRFPRAAIASLPFLIGCEASVQADLKVKDQSQAVEPNDFDKPLDKTAEAVAVEKAKPENIALLGARQDLTFSGPQAATCKCLAVVVGQPSDPAFRWAGQRPQTNSDQLVVALSSTGVTCPDGGNGTRAASYWGYETTGNDVVVVVENAGSGRPIATGAIIPRPTGSGQVYVRPADKSVPYGRPLGGGADKCQVGHLSSSATASPAEPTPGNGVHIRTDEAEPMSSKMNQP